jgi:endonuclease/exonuclease/phosphatase family metal-dependent hydrolase
VLLGGDFNGEPDTAPLDLMYPKALNGSGDFTEYNRSGSSRDGQDTAHSDGSNTDDGLPYSKKIDYVFFSRNHAPLDGPAVDIHKDASDHDMLTSSAMMQK